MEWSLSYANECDEKDALKTFRNEFYTHSDDIYLDGNSLGLLSKRAEQSLLALLTSWKKHCIDGWAKGEEPWFYLSEKLGVLTAPLLGAMPHEVILTGSTTTNLHQMIATFYTPNEKKNKILSDSLTFPSDIYALQSQLRLKGFQPTEHLIQITSPDGQTLDEEQIISQMTEEVALVFLPSVLYRSGQVLNIEKLTQAAKERDILIGFDLAHSIGIIPHQLHDWNVDFAIFCTYKYLNGGPGAVGGIYVHDTHFPCSPGLQGWFGSKKEKQFDMDYTFEADEKIGAFQIGTPHIFSLAPLLGSLELFHQTTIDQIRTKSLALTEFFLLGIKEDLHDFSFKICNPIPHFQRGGHIYIEHDDAIQICKALKAKGVTPDFRAPKGIRFAPVPFYNSFTDIYRCVQLLKEIMEQKTYVQYTNTREVIA